MKLNNAKFRWAPNDTVRDHYRIAVDVNEETDEDDDEDFLGKIDGDNLLQKAIKKARGGRKSENKAG